MKAFKSASINMKRKRSKDDSDEEEVRNSKYKKQKKEKKVKKEKKEKKKKKKEKNASKRKERDKEGTSSNKEEVKTDLGNAKRMVPMTREEWERQQSEVRRYVYLFVLYVLFILTIRHLFIRNVTYFPGNNPKKLFLRFKGIRRRHWTNAFGKGVW